MNNMCTLCLIELTDQNPACHDCGFCRTCHVLERAGPCMESSGGMA